jgi:hypothetical protein
MSESDRMSPDWPSPGSILGGTSSICSCRAHLCTGELDLVVLELNWSNCELAAAKTASRICSASAQANTAMAIGTAVPI